jgi:hypothetical protein
MVPVRSRDRNSQRDASYIYDDVAFAAEFSSLSRGGARFLASTGLDTLAPSILARLQSTMSAMPHGQAWCAVNPVAALHRPSYPMLLDPQLQSTSCSHPPTMGASGSCIRRMS